VALDSVYPTDYLPFVFYESICDF